LANPARPFISLLGGGKVSDKIGFIKALLSRVDLVLVGGAMSYTFLKAEGKKINVLYAHNDDMAIGAIQAIEEAGMKPGKDIIIISIDGVKGAFEAMMAGKLNVTVECSPLLGPQLMQIAKDIKAGKDASK
jgi:simple sugar transport system substrate-binding protein